MTPAQLRAFAAVVRLGSVKQAASELAVSESAVSLHVAHLRKELADELFTRTAAGLAFTPGGLRLARRAAEMLSLQERTVLEVSQAGHDRRLLRAATSSLFAEYAAPGLIEAFTSRAPDLDVELSVQSPRRFAGLLHNRAVDVTIGPRVGVRDDDLACRPFLHCPVIIVAGPGHPLAAGNGSGAPCPEQLAEQMWLLGPSAATENDAIADVVRTIGVPEARQRIFQSHAAALEEVQRDRGISAAPALAVRRELARGALIRLGGKDLRFESTWCTLTLDRPGAPAVAAEFARFAATPRATQAMLRGPGVQAGRFRPAVHITLWN